MGNVGELIRPAKLKISSEETLSEAYSKMVDEKIPNAVVFEGNSFRGVLSLRAVLRGFTAFSNAKTKNFLETFVPKLNPEDKIEKCAKLMAESYCRILPVYYENKLVGFVYAEDIIAKAFEEFEIENIELGSIMKNAVFVEKNDTIGKVLHIMRSENIKQVPVIGDSGKVEGIITLENLIKNYFIHMTPKRELFSLKGHEPEAKSMFEIPVEDLMESVQGFEKGKKLSQVKNDVISLKTILVGNKKPLGIISTKDILELISGIQKQSREISISGMPEMSDFDKEIVINRINHFYDKIERICKEKPRLVIRFKSYRESGMRKNHEISIRVVSGKISANAKTDDWNLLTALEEGFDIIYKRLINEKEKQ